MKFNPFSTAQWISWIAATLVAGITMIAYAMAYAHSNFMTVREKQTIIERLDRIEDKQDDLLLKLTEWRNKHQNK